MLQKKLPNVWLLSGPLGSGKTTFARGLLRALGYAGRVASPTFVLRHDFSVHHEQWKRVVHVDAYRLRNQHEEAALDLESASADPSCLVLIEWPEKLRHHVGDKQLSLTFSHRRRGRRVALSRAI